MGKMLMHILLLLIVPKLWAQELDIGIMRDYQLGTIEISYHTGNYEIYGDTTLVTNLWQGQSILFKRVGIQVEGSV